MALFGSTPADLRTISIAINKTMENRNGDPPVPHCTRGENRGGVPCLAVSATVCSGYPQKHLMVYLMFGLQSLWRYRHRCPPFCHLQVSHPVHRSTGQRRKFLAHRPVKERNLNPFQVPV